MTTNGMDGVRGQPAAWLRIESLAVLVLAVVLYARGDHSWVMFALLFLAPDLSFAAYAAGPRAGAVVYNALHSYVGPVALGLALGAAGRPLAIPLVWAAHVALDRMLGFGLKYPDAFQHTHLGVIGRRPLAGD